MRKLLLAAAMSLVVGPGAQAATPTSDFCKKWYNDIRHKPANRSMALSTDGKICHSVWGVGNQLTADRQAVRGCEDGGKRKCGVVRR